MLNTSNLKSLSQLIETQKALSTTLTSPLHLSLQAPADDSPLQVKCESPEEAKAHLFQAVKKGQTDKVRWLLAYQPEWIHLQTPSGMTLLHVAVQENQWPVAELLLTSGAKISSQNNKGAGLLHSAIAHPDLVKQLIKRAPLLLEMRDVDGNTPLHYAADQNLVNTAKVLLEHKAWLEAKNNAGQTALHVAALAGHAEMVKFLLENEANYQALDKNSCLPMALAEQQGHFKVENLFLKHQQTLRNKKALLEKHTGIMGKLSKAQYYLLDKVYPSEADDLKQQTGVSIDFKGQKYYVWPEKGGHFGRVGLARNAETGRFVAVKTITGEEKISASINEGRLQKELEGQPGLMPLFDYAYLEEQGKIYQFMLYAEFGDGRYLKQQLSKLNQPELLWLNPSLKIKTLAHVAKSLLTACRYMHQVGIAHHDIKPDNLLIDRYGRVYLSDFGCALAENGKTKYRGGDVRYFAPEKLKLRVTPADAGPYDPFLADAWAIGLTLLEIASFLEPQQDFNPEFVDLTPDYVREKIEGLLYLLGTGLFEVIKGLVAINPDERLSVQAALEHPLFQDPLFDLTDEERVNNFAFITEMATLQSAPIVTPIAPLPSPKAPGSNKQVVQYDDVKPNNDNIGPGDNPPYKPVSPAKVGFFVPAPAPVEPMRNAEVIYLYNEALQAEKNNQLDKARALYSQCHELGNANATFKLGELERKAKNKEGAYDYYVQAAKKDHSVAMVNVAQMLEYGDGVKQNKSAALEWYQRLLTNNTEYIGKDKEGNTITTQSKIDKLKTASPALKH